MRSQRLNARGHGHRLWMHLQAVARSLHGNAWLAANRQCHVHRLAKPCHSAGSAARAVALGVPDEERNDERMQTWFKQLLSVTLATFVMFSQSACTQQDRVVAHGVEADFGRDSPNLVVDEFHYGQSKGPGMHMKNEDGRGTGNPSSYGETLMPDEVVVKWHDTTTGKAYEDRVDMRKRLGSPSDLRGKHVYFLIDQFENQLYIYLVPDIKIEDGSTKRKQGTMPNGPSLYADLDVKTVYPDGAVPRPRGGYSEPDMKLWGITSAEGLVVK